MGIGSRVRQQTVMFLGQQGTAVLTTLCVALVTAAALWYPQHDKIAAPPAQTDALSAARLVQQTLPAVTPVPSASPVLFTQPLTALAVLQPFDDTAMVRSSTTGVWRVHDAVTLSGQPGEAVRAMTDGTVLSCTEDGPGCWRIVLTHGNGLTAEYTGPAETNVSPGQTVQAGAIIGRLENRTDALPILVLRVTRDGIPVDPLSLFGGS